MTDQNLVPGDIPYPTYQVTDRIEIKGSTPVTTFAKGEFATVDDDGLLIKLTTTRIEGLVQVKNAVESGLVDDDSAEVAICCERTRIIVPLPINAHKGQYVQINGVNGTGNVVVSVAAADTLNLGIGRIFKLYKTAAKKSIAGDLAIVDFGVGN